MEETVSVENLRVRLEGELMRLPGVVGVGTGRKEKRALFGRLHLGARRGGAAAPAAGAPDVFP